MMPHSLDALPLTMLDLLIHNATFRRPQPAWVWPCKDQPSPRFRQAFHLNAAAGQYIDAEGQLLCPLFVDAHLHLSMQP